MKCPQCEEVGLKSKVQSGETMTTLAGYVSYYDEEGRLHDHDDNTRSTEYRCSNGHAFVYRHENSCWCGWKGKTKKFTMLKY